MNNKNLYNQNFNAQARKRIMDIENLKTRRAAFVDRVLAPMTLFCMINFAVFTAGGVALQGTNLVLKATTHNELSAKVEDASKKTLELALLWLSASATGGYLRLVLELYTKMED